MFGRVLILAMVPTIFFASLAGAQYPILNMIADKVVQNYQHSTCEQLLEKKRQPKPPEEQEIVAKLRADTQMRAMFIDKVAAPIANKMFECGLIP